MDPAAPAHSMNLPQRWNSGHQTRQRCERQFCRQSAVDDQTKTAGAKCRGLVLADALAENRCIDITRVTGTEGLQTGSNSGC